MTINDYAEQATTLFVLPDSVTQLKSCMDDDAASIDDVGDIILTDPALTAHLLKVSNSPLYRFPKKIDTISRGLQVIGTRAAYDLALAYGVSHAFKDSSSPIIDIERFWEQSICCGLLAKHIADFHKHRDSERFFVAGLLNNIGELIVAQANPVAAAKCLDLTGDISPPQRQARVLGFDYASLSALILDKWQIPETIWQPLQAIHTCDNDLLSRDAQILRLAYFLALDNVSNESFNEYTQITEGLHTRLDMENADLEEALDSTNLQCISLMSLFSPTSFMLY